MQLQTNQDKTKYIPVTKKDCTNGPAQTEIGSYKFEVVQASFTLDQRLITKMTSVMI
jgi:hypothetical protein